VVENYDPDGPEGPLTAHEALPPDGTIVAVPAVKGGVLQELDGTSTTKTTAVDELEIPVNAEDFLREEDDVAGVPAPLRPYVGRRAAEVLGKALFWDMQVGSDGVQSCGSCHFHAGVDNRTKNQLNPGHLSTPVPDLTYQVKGPNEEVVAADFPFHKRVDPKVVGDGATAGVASRDANDVMSSMGVSRFKTFVNIPAIGSASFLAASGGVKALRPDVGADAPDPIPDMDGFRRVEPRNTPTMHAAAYNLDNFWDGRARFNFNGGSVFGPSDPQHHVYVGPIVGALHGASMGDLRPDLEDEDPELAEQPVRVKFASLASQAVGPPLSDFEMSFAGRNWQKIGKKLLQPSTLQLVGFNDPLQNPIVNQAVPLANQRVSPNDSVLGPFSGQRSNLGGPVNRAGRPGLNISYPALIRLAFAPRFWRNISHHLRGAACASDPFDGYCLTAAPLPANPVNRDQFTQMEANFSLFFALAVQSYEELLIPDDTPFDRFMDANPNVGNGIGQPGEQAVLFPTLVADLVRTPGTCPTGTTRIGALCFPEGFGPEELFGFDIFAGGNVTAALPTGHARNPRGFGSNPFTRSARCMLCHLGPEQTDHSINIAHGLLKGDAEFEYPSPPTTGLVFTGPGGNTAGVPVPPPTIEIPSPEPPGLTATVRGLILAEEVEETPQDAVEVEPRNFVVFDDPSTSWDDRVVGQPTFFAFGDQGIYNVGLRPNGEDLGRGGTDPFGWPLSLSALSLINIAGDGNGGPATPATAYRPCDGTIVDCIIGNVDADDLETIFEESGDGVEYPDAPGFTVEAVNPGLERSPTVPLLPAYMAPWTNGLPAGELHPQIDEMAGFAPNTMTPPNGGPAIEFAEVLFGADQHCGRYDPVVFGDQGPGAGWGPPAIYGDQPVCPNNQSGTAGNLDYPVHGTWPVPNRVLKDGTFKAPALRNVELTGPYFHTGSYLTLRQVVDFYLRGGDFPLTNAESRDPNLVDVARQAFGFGRTAGDDLGVVSSGILVGNLGDALPDTAYRYDAMPDTDHPLTPEPPGTNDEAARNALVRFLISLTDPRVKHERAPFDRPEMFVPVDGKAPENTRGRATLVALSTLAGSGLTCAGAACFRQIPEVGGTGHAAPLPNFLGVLSTPGNCDASAGPISHFCP
jgi:cytochrome c peroxidase